MTVPPTPTAAVAMLEGIAHDLRQMGLPRQSRRIIKGLGVLTKGQVGAPQPVPVAKPKPPAGIWFAPHGHIVPDTAGRKWIRLDEHNVARLDVVTRRTGR